MVEVDLPTLIKKALKGHKKIKNIEIIEALLPHKQYIGFLQSLDCYVLLSKGEGLSFDTLREALALSKPCIISDNTAHHTIAKTGFVYAVPSNIKEPAKYDFGVFGYQFNCKVEDVQKALREVYVNYNLYLQKAEQGRNWVQRYLWENVKT